MRACAHTAPSPHLALLTTSGGPVGGMETFTRGLVGRLLQMGWRVTAGVNGYDFFTPEPPITTERISERCDAAHDRPMCIERLAWINPADLSGDRRYRWDAIVERFRWFRRIRPDVALFVQSSNTPLRASVVAARLAGVPVVTTQRTMPAQIPATASGRHCFGLLPGLDLHRRRIVWGSRLTAILANRVVYNSAAVRRMYEDQYGYPVRKGAVILNAASMCRAMPRIESSDAHRPVVIGFVGRLGREKRIDVLLQAISRLGGHPPIRLDLYGDGPERAALLELATQLGLSERVRFCGTSTNVEEVYPKLDIVVLCSPRESSSNMVLEAMAAGCAVVVTRAGGLPELVDDGSAGVCVEPLNVEELAEKLSQLVRDPCARRQLGQAARARAMRYHDPAGIYGQWCNLLQGVAGRSASSVGQEIATSRQIDARAAGLDRFDDAGDRQETREQTPLAAPVEVCP